MRLLVRQGTTVLLTTQYLDEADQLSDRIAVMDHGKIIADGTPSQLRHRWARECCASGWPPPPRARPSRSWPGLGVTVRAAPGSAALTAQIEGAPQIRHQRSGRLGYEPAGALRIKVTTFALGQPSLDEVFLALTGHAVQDNAEAGEAA